jgi:hypothetical protein
MGERYFIVSESELRELIHDSLKLCALENGGVDNWEWYGASIQDFIEANGNPDYGIFDIAEKELENYDVLED